MLALVIVLTAVLIASLACLVLVQQRRMRESYEHAEYRKDHLYTEADLRERRLSALKQSRSTVTGQAAEHLTPLVPEFLDEFNPRDWQWLGQPVDFLIWDGLDDDGKLKRLVVVEVKSGVRAADLSTKQRRIRELIERKKVGLEWMHVDLSDPSDPKKVESALVRQSRFLRERHGRSAEEPPGPV